MRILIAEDDFLSRNILATVLKKQGHEVIETKDGKGALKILQSEDAPKLAILDWMMPELEGLEVVKTLREGGEKYPVYLIMVTAKSRKEDIVAGLDAGANDYLVKPVDMGELRARIRVAERMVELQDALAQQVTQLEEALEHIKTLQGVLPICSYCKKIRDDQGYWDQVESYISSRSDAMFSHSICPECMEKEFPEYYEKYLEQEKADRQQAEGDRTKKADHGHDH